jgi:hypothetical protein
MAKQNEHGKLIAAAARTALTPLGCRREGQSRSWISDHGYWIIVIEFQPSAWQKGTYLNVSPHWLWLRMGSGEAWERVGDFIPFESIEQFRPLVEDLAAQGAQRVLELRERFRSLADVNNHFANRVSSDGFPVYRAAVTAGLVGEVTTARRLFHKMEELDDEGYTPWIKLKAECAAFAARLDDSEQYRSAALSVVTELRQHLRLPPDSQCLEATDAIRGRQ